MDFFKSLGKIFTSGEYLGLLFKGLGNTLLISFGAAALGLILGVIVAIVKISAKKNKFMKIPSLICSGYVTIIRSTPVALQLFVMAGGILAIRGFPIVITAILTFGLNSGAYVSESIRAGIQSIDDGQTEAGRSLGLSGAQTMTSIVLPQAVKNILPSIANEFIALIKETAIVSMIGLVDLTLAAKLIGAPNELAEFFAPMVVSALFYFVIVYSLTLGVKYFERRMAKSDRS